MATKVIDRGERQLFFDTQQIAGLQSYAVSYQLATEKTQGLGSESSIFIPNGVNQVSASISTLVFTNQDYLIGLTGSEAFNGYLLTSRTDKSNNFCFTSGYLTAYKSSCSVGDVPKIDIDIFAVGDAGGFSNDYINGNSKVSSDLSVIQTGFYTGNLVTVGYGGIDLQATSWSSDAVQSYSLEIGRSRNPIYKIGSKYPVEVKSNPPANLTLQISMYAKDYQCKNTSDYPKTQPTESITITVKDYNTKETVLSYSLPNMLLAQEEYSTNKDGFAVVSLTYQK